jgi:hypothetical protein
MGVAFGPIAKLVPSTVLPGLTMYIKLALATSPVHAKAQTASAKTAATRSDLSHPVVHFMSYSSSWFAPNGTCSANFNRRPLR